MGAEKFTPTGIRFQDCPARSQSLYRLRFPGPHIEACFRIQGRAWSRENVRKIKELTVKMAAQITLKSKGR